MRMSGVLTLKRTLSFVKTGLNPGLPVTFGVCSGIESGAIFEVLFPGQKGLRGIGQGRRDHFVDVNKMVQLGSGSVCEIDALPPRPVELSLLKTAS